MQHLEQRVKQSGCNGVRFCGFRNQSELPRFFDLATVFVLPSQDEPWGLIVNEVMNAGRAVHRLGRRGMPTGPDRGWCGRVCLPCRRCVGPDSGAAPCASNAWRLRRPWESADGSESRRGAMRKIFAGFARGSQRRRGGLVLDDVRHILSRPKQNRAAILNDGGQELMRILHIIGTLNPEAGGPTESVRVLLSYGPIGYTGEVVTLDDPSAPYLHDFEFPVHALGPTNTTYGFNSKLLPWLRNNRHRFDGVVVNGLWQYCGYAAWRALAGNTPYVVFTHGMLDPYFKHAFPLKHIKKWLYWVPFEYWVLRGAYRVLFTSKAEKRLAERASGCIGGTLTWFPMAPADRREIQRYR